MNRLTTSRLIKVALLGLVSACAGDQPTSNEAPPQPGTTGARASPGSTVSASNTGSFSTVPDFAAISEEFGSSYSLDSIEPHSTTVHISWEDAAVQCRDHFNAIDLFWNGPHGIVSFHLDPPLLFNSYRGGSYRGLAKAIYENVGTVYGTDFEDNEWAI